MKTIYVYLFYSDYSENHIRFMTQMLSCLSTARELHGLAEKERPDINALELAAEASPWAIEFLEHMDNCDMLYVRDTPIVG